MILIEFISTDIGSRKQALFTSMDSRMDFDLPHNVPAVPSSSNPLQLTPLKISRATYKIDEVAHFYTTVFNATIILRQEFDAGNEKLVLKLPDVSTGNSSVHLQFWTPVPGTDVAATALQNHSASCTAWTVESWESYLIRCAENDMVSKTCGFPKSLDFHLSFDCVDSDCVLDDVAARLDAMGVKYRWANSPRGGGELWWLLYITEPTGYGVETHYVRWVDPPDPSAIPPGCFGTYANGTCNR